MPVCDSHSNYKEQTKQDQRHSIYKHVTVSQTVDFFCQSRNHKTAHKKHADKTHAAKAQITSLFFFIFSFLLSFILFIFQNIL